MVDACGLTGTVGAMGAVDMTERMIEDSESVYHKSTGEDAESKDMLRDSEKKSMVIVILCRIK